MAKSTSKKKPPAKKATKKSAKKAEARKNTKRGFPMRGWKKGKGEERLHKVTVNGNTGIFTATRHVVKDEPRWKLKLTLEGKGAARNIGELHMKAEQLQAFVESSTKTGTPAHAEIVKKFKLDSTTPSNKGEEKPTSKSAAFEKHRNNNEAATTGGDLESALQSSGQAFGNHLLDAVPDAVKSKFDYVERHPPKASDMGEHSSHPAVKLSGSIAHALNEIESKNLDENSTGGVLRVHAAISPYVDALPDGDLKNHARDLLKGTGEILRLSGVSDNAIKASGVRHKLDFEKHWNAAEAKSAASKTPKKKATTAPSKTPRKKAAKKAAKKAPAKAKKKKAAQKTKATAAAETAAMSANQKKAALAIRQELLSIGFEKKKGGQSGFENLYTSTDPAAQSSVRKCLKQLGFTFDAAQASMTTALWFEHPTFGRVESGAGAGNVWNIRHILPLR